MKKPARSLPDTNIIVRYLVADDHVISRHGLRDGAGSTTGTEEPVGDFLSGADFGESAVDGVGEVDLESFFKRAGAIVNGIHAVES